VCRRPLGPRLAEPRDVPDRHRRAIGFLAGCPYSALDWRAFWGDVRATQENINFGWLGFENVRNMWLYSLTVYLPAAMGGRSRGVLIRHRVGRGQAPREDLLLAAFVVFYFAYLGRYTHHVHARYWVLVLPFTSVLVARFLWDVCARLRLWRGLRFSRRWRSRPRLPFRPCAATRGSCGRPRIF